MRPPLLALGSSVPDSEPRLASAARGRKGSAGRRPPLRARGDRAVPPRQRPGGRSAARSSEASLYCAMPETSGSTRLYLDDPERTRFRSRVLERLALPAGGVGLVLAETCFYPTSGGQPHDTGI